MNQTAAARSAPFDAVAPAARSAPRLGGMPVIGNVLEFRRGPLQALERAAREHGAVTRLSLAHETLFFVNHPDPIRRVLVDNHRSYSRSQNLEIPKIRGFLGDGMLTTDGDLWLRLRRASQPAFGHGGIAFVATRIAEAVAAVTDGWDERIANGQPVDVFPELVALTLTTALRAFFDYACSPEDAAESAQALIEGQAHVLDEIKRPYLPSWVPTPARSRFRRANTRVEALVDRAVRLRADRSADSARGDMLDLLTGHRDRTTGEGLSEKELHDQLLTNLVAAPENTATAITWCLYLLARHPEAEASVLAELGAAAAPAGPYTRLVIDETLRLYPGAPYFDRRALEDDILAGCSIPKGSLIMIAPYVLHRDPAFFREPLAFRPERFDAGGDGLNNRAYMPFGLGPRKCVGDRFARMLLEMVIPALLARYRFTLASTDPVAVDPAINLRPRGGMLMKVTAR